MPLRRCGMHHNKVMVPAALQARSQAILSTDVYVLVQMRAREAGLHFEGWISGLNF